MRAPAFGPAQAAAYEEARKVQKAVNAAPELLEALRLLVADVAQYEAWQRPCHALDVARAALFKATGHEDGYTPRDNAHAEGAAS